MNQDPNNNTPLFTGHTTDLGLVLSGGGSRAAYQVGAIKALMPYFEDEKNIPKIIIGSSIGSINSLILGSCLKNGIGNAVESLEEVWRERDFRNTFHGTPSGAFFRAIKMALLQYMSPGPKPSSSSLFDPTPLLNRVDQIIQKNGGLRPEDRNPNVKAIGLMTTIEGEERKPLLFLSTGDKILSTAFAGASFSISSIENLTAKHGFASAALPSVLPPVELDTEHGKIKLVDGGISSNIPVDPAVRLGAGRVILVDVSGRNWWLTRYNEPLDKRPDWEVPAGLETFCLRPPETFVVRCQKPLGPILKEAVSGSRKKFIAALGPTWPIFTLLKNKLGEDIAYETVSYVALDKDYLSALIERGYEETKSLLKNRTSPQFEQQESFKEWVEEVNTQHTV